MRSWRGYDHLITAGEATVTWTIPGTRPHYTTGGVRAGLPKAGALLTEKDIRARVQDFTTAGPEMENTGPAPSPQIITIAQTQEPLEVS